MEALQTGGKISRQIDQFNLVADTGMNQGRDRVRWDQTPDLNADNYRVALGVAEKEFFGRLHGVDPRQVMLDDSDWW